MMLQFVASHLVLGAIASQRDGAHPSLFFFFFCVCFDHLLAHLSRRLQGELLVYQ